MTHDSVLPNSGTMECSNYGSSAPGKVPLTDRSNAKWRMNH